MLPARLVSISLGLAAILLLPLDAGAAGDAKCFDVVTPSLKKALDSREGQLLVIQARSPSPGASLAAATLAKEAERRGLKAEVQSEPCSWGNSEGEEREHAVKVSSDKNAQLVAFVEFLTAGETATARIEIRDHSGQKLASAFVWLTDAANCPSDIPRAAGLLDGPRAAGISWYGYELLLSDLAALSLLSVVPKASLAMYVLVPPLMHAYHDNVWGAGLSLALRLGLPLAGGVLSSRRGSGEDSLDVAIGVAMGAFVAMLVDDLYLTWKKIPAQADVPEARSQGYTSEVSMGIAMLPSPQGATLGLVGQF